MAPTQNFVKNCSNQLATIKKSSFFIFCQENLLLILLSISLFASIIIGCIVKLATGSKKYDPHEIAYIEFPGTLYLNALKMMIIPLVVSSLMTGMASLDMQASGKFGTKTVLYYLTTTSIAVVIGIVVVCVIRPGAGIDKAELGKAEDEQLYTEIFDAITDLIRNMIPPNIVASCFQSYRTEFKLNKICAANITRTKTTDPADVDMSKCYTYAGGGFSDKSNILGLVVFSCIFGVVIGKMGERGEPIKNFMVALMEATMKIIRTIIWFTPVGIFFLLLSKILEMDNWAETIQQLGWFSFSVMLALAIHAFIVLPLIYFLFTKKNPLKLLMGVSPALMTAFATASSAATLPVTLACLEQNVNIDRRVTRFIIPIGATINMDGTALYEAVAAMFIAQLNGVDSFPRVLTISITATLASIGAAAVPQAGLITLVVVLNAARLPLEDIALIAAIDWFLDRSRTSINVWGDSIGAGIIYEHSKEDLKNLPDPFEKEDMGKPAKKKQKKDRLSGLDIHMVVMADDDGVVAKTKEDAATPEKDEEDAATPVKNEEDVVMVKTEEDKKAEEDKTETDKEVNKEEDEEKKDENTDDDTKNDEGAMEEDRKNDEGAAKMDEDSGGKDSAVDNPKDSIITINE